MELSTLDLILCSNLLLADAKMWENMCVGGEIHPVAAVRARECRDLNTRLVIEIQRRDPISHHR